MKWRLVFAIFKNEAFTSVEQIFTMINPLSCVSTLNTIIVKEYNVHFRNITLQYYTVMQLHILWYMW